MTSIKAQSDQYSSAVNFPAAFQVGDYIEFLRVGPISSGASGYYEVSISYVRGNIAAASTHLVSMSHANPAIWREAGRINANGYASPGQQNFTIDCNTEFANPRFRIRAINNFGVNTSDLYVNIKVRSINHNASWTQLNTSGNDLSVISFVPMTNDWSLYVGNPYFSVGASLAIKAIENGNVGIGTAFPTEKLSVKGKIRAQEIKVDNANWPDWVFKADYKLASLAETEKHIKEKGYLPGIPSAEEVENNGISIGEMNAKLLLKIEEITLHL
ncbi:MAG: hypothetical protein EOP48_21100, partial [Sphingobacteriales bacterium]